MSGSSFGPDRAHEHRPALGLELLEEVREIGRVQRQGELGRGLGVAGGQGASDVPDQLVAELGRPLLAAGRLGFRHAGLTIPKPELARLPAIASPQATALMLTMPRAVTEPVTMCAGSAGPTRTGPMETTPVTLFRRL